jgi:cell division protein FtsL
MITYNKQPDNSFRWIYRICFAFAAAVALFLAFSSCTSSTKHFNKSKTFVDSSYIHELESRLRSLSIENEHLQKTINELQYSSVVFETDTSCNEELRAALIKAGINADSLIGTMNSLKNKVKFYADGSFEAEGKLKNATFQKNKVQELNYQLKKENDSLSEVKQKVIAVKTARTILKEKTVKKKTWWLFFLTLGLITGCLVWDKFGARIKKFLSPFFLFIRGLLKI